MVQGPINRPKDAIAPLSGIIETDWAPYTFTMNWKFTRPGTIVRFEAGEPFCHFFPVKRGEIEDFTPRMRSLEEVPDIKRQHDRWMNERLQFIEDLRDPTSKAREDRWQKTYFRGLDPDGKEQPDHRTRVKLKPFAK